MSAARRQPGSTSSARAVPPRTASASGAGASEARTPVTRDAIVDAAMGLVEAQGIDALTMRRLSDELGVAVTAIYWHVGQP